MRTLDHQYEFVVVGGGLAGICAAVTASRKNIKTALTLSTICLGSNFKTIDPSNYNLLQGSRQSFFFLTSPFLLNYSLKTKI